MRDPRLNVIRGGRSRQQRWEGARVNEFTPEGLRDSFIAGGTDLVEVVYMKFFSMSRQKPDSVEQLFPSVREAVAQAMSPKKDDNQLYIFPSRTPNRIFNEVLPMFVLPMMQEITVENRARSRPPELRPCRARMTTPRNCFEELQLEYNKLRQQSITTELLRYYRRPGGAVTTYTHSRRLRPAECFFNR